MKSVIKVIEVIIFSLLALAETVLLIGIIGATVAPVEGRDPIRISSSVPMALCMALLTAISIAAIVRITYGKRIVIASAMLMEIFVFAMGMSMLVFSFDIYDRSIIALFCIMMAVCSGLGAGAAALGKYADSLSPAKPQKPQAFVPQMFDCEKAEWLWELAADEYYGGSRPQEISESDNDMIYGYAAMPMASFLYWLVQRDLISPGFRADLPENMEEDIKARRCTPAELIRSVDFRFSKDMAVSEMYQFINSYYWDCAHGTNMSLPHSFDTNCYMFDYFDIFGDTGRLFVNQFSDEKQLKLEKLLDKRCGDFDEPSIYEYRQYDTVQSVLFGQADIYASDKAEPEYIRRCVNEICSPDSTLTGKIRARLEKFAKETFFETQDVFRDFGKASVYIPAPEDDRTAYMVLGGGLDEEHGCGFSVKGGYVSAAAIEDSVENPWSDYFDREYMLENPGEDRQMYIIPPEFGGADTPDNYISAPSGLAYLKETCDRRILCMNLQGYDLSYACEPVFQNDRIFGVRIEAERKNGRNAFYDYLHLPY